MAIINKIGVHHTGGLETNKSASTQDLSASRVNEIHKFRQEWIGYSAHKSELGLYGGYNIFIDKDGVLTQYRLLGEETLAAKGSNFDTVHICLAGNFSVGVDMPTLNQKMRLKSLLNGLMSESPESLGLKIKPGTLFNFSKQNIFPHRGLDPRTSCFGTALPDSWARELVNSIGALQEKKNLLKRLKHLYKELMRLKSSLGRQISDCFQSETLG